MSALGVVNNKSQEKTEAVFKVGFIGAGQGATNLYRMIRGSVVSRVEFICDRDTEAPLMLLSKKRKIPTYTDLEEAFSKHEVDYVLDATGAPQVLQYLKEKFPDGSRTTILEGRVSLFIYKMVEDQFGDEISDDNAIDDQFLSFKIAAEDYAFPLMQVMEIITEQEITPLPNVANYLMGVINLRGAVIPVLSLRKLFHMEELAEKKEDEEDKTCIIILQIGDKKCGVRVDAVNEVVNITEDKIFAAPQQLDASKATGEEDKRSIMIEGIGKLEGENVVVIINLDKILNGLDIPVHN